MNVLSNLWYNAMALAYQALETPQHAAEQAAEHGAEQAENLGAVLMHHAQNTNEFEFLIWKFHLPEFHIAGYDIVISKHIVMVWIAALITFLVFKFGMKWENRVPKGMTSFFEPIIVFIRDEIVYANLGKDDGRKFLPFFLTIFFFVLFLNLLGMVPFMAAATGNINTTAALAAITFVVTQVAGIVKNGFFTHWKNLVPSGVPLWILPILIPVELMGMMAKPFALCIRLFANMTAGHIVILAFLGLIITLQNYFIGLASVPAAMAISGLELCIAFLQAYIFTFLSALFVSMSYHPAH